MLKEEKPCSVPFNNPEDILTPAPTLICDQEKDESIMPSMKRVKNEEVCEEKGEVVESPHMIKKVKITITKLKIAWLVLDQPSIEQVSTKR